VPAVGLTDGLAPRERYAYDKQQREQNFPFKLAQEALTINLEKASASVESDKLHIINKMIGSADLNTPLPEKFEGKSRMRLDTLNQTLRACFAAGSLRAALENRDGDSFFSTLASGRLRELSLDFTGGTSFDAEAAKTLACSLPVTLEKLTLRSDDIGPALTRALSPWLGVTGVLTTLDLRWNDIGDEGAGAIGDALRVNGTLTSLNLRGNDIGTTGWCTIFNALRENKDNKIVSWDLSRQGIDDEAAKAVAAYVANSKTLTSVNLEGNRINRDGAAAIGGALKANRVLTQLNLSENEIGGEANARLREIAAARPSLTLDF
jgi:hypothetical protein